MSKMIILAILTIFISSVLSINILGLSIYGDSKTDVNVETNGAVSTNTSASTSTSVKTNSKESDVIAKINAKTELNLSSTDQDNDAP